MIFLCLSSFLFTNTKLFIIVILTFLPEVYEHLLKCIFNNIMFSGFLIEANLMSWGMTVYCSINVFLYFIGTLDFLHLLVFYILGYLSLLSNFFVYAQSFSHVSLFETPWTLSTWLLCPWDFPGRNNEWSALPFPSPGDLPDPGMKLHLLY